MLSVLDKMFNLGSLLFKAQHLSEAHLQAEKRPDHQNPHLKNRYGITHNSHRVNEAFLDLKDRIFSAIDKNRQAQLQRGNFSPEFFRESGRIGEGRRYFYIKKSGERGWLFERAGNGWIISRCEKIVSTNTFLRGEEVWDIVNLFAHESDSSIPLRMSSHRTGGDIISTSVYERKLLVVLQLE